MLFRTRVLDYLVDELGFTAIAIESGIVEGRVIHDYVRGGDGELEEVLAEGLSWTFDDLPQNESLVRWLRDYNADSTSGRMVNFYGFDVPGSPGNPQAARGLRVALDEALNYLGDVDAESLTSFRDRLEDLLPSIQFPPYTMDGPGYHLLSQSERDGVTAAIADLVALLERRQADYMTASSPSEYQWGYRAAIGARQVDAWLRLIPVGWERGDDGRFLGRMNVRDRGQADNLDWIVRQEGPSGKILVFASRFHGSASSVIGLGGMEGTSEVMGTYLRRRYGERLLTIGNLRGPAEIGCGDFWLSYERGPLESIDGLVGELGVPLFLLDLRTAPSSLAEWVGRRHRLADGEEVNLGRAFDVLFYVDEITPACLR